MRYIELQEAFEIELNKLDDNMTKPTSNVTEYFLNAGLDKFWKSRYSQNNFKREAFEQSQKRIDDLRTLVKEHEYSSSDINYTSQGLSKGCRWSEVTLPKDYVLLLGDRAGISPAPGKDNECWDKDENGKYIPHYSDPIEGTIDTLDRIKENSLSEYHLKYTYAKPIRIMLEDSIRLYTEDTYIVSNYIIQYLRKPNKIDIHANPYAEYTDMPEHTHLEIVKLAAQLYIENQADQRYNSYTQEVIPSME